VRTDFILDFETIGQCAYKIPALDCSYRTFIWDRFLDQPYTFEELINGAQKTKLDIKHQVEEFKYTYTKEDLDWWLSQDASVKSVLKPTPNDVTVFELL